METLRERITGEIPHLRRYARTLTGQKDEADDLVQVCLEKALINARKWNPQQGLRPWLFRILYNSHISHHRRRQREYRFSTDYPRTDRVAANQESATELDGLGELLAAMPREQRDALLLVAVEGLTYDEAAQVLSVAVGTIRSRIARAREVLRAGTDNASPSQSAERGAR